MTSTPSRYLPSTANAHHVRRGTPPLAALENGDPLQARPKFSAANERCGKECIYPSVTYHDQRRTFGRRCACSRQVQEAISGEGKCTLHRCVVLSASLLFLAHATYPAFLVLRSYSRLARSSGPRDGRGMRIRCKCPRTDQCISATKCPPIPV